MLLGAVTTAKSIAATRAAANFFNKGKNALSKAKIDIFHSILGK